MVGEWAPNPAPTWVTCVPSLRHADLVPDFSMRLAAALGLPFHTVIAKTDDRPEQKTMANSTQQARNIDGSLSLNGQGKSSSDLLSPGEYKRLAQHLRELKHQPADLLSPDADELLKRCQIIVDADRLQRLLGRGFLLSQVIERLASPSHLGCESGRPRLSPSSETQAA